MSSLSPLSLNHPSRVVQQRAAFRAALDAGVTICAGSDAGVFTHGENALELELMVEYGMSPVAALASATSVNALLFGLADRVGRIEPGLLADLVAVDGDPAQHISALRQVVLVIQSGTVVRSK